MNDFDLALTDASYVQDPYPVLAALRREAPVYWCEPWQCWIVTRYDDVAWVHRNDGALFSSAARTVASLRLLPDIGWSELEVLPTLAGLFEEDQPRYTYLRQLVSRGLLPKVGGLADRVTELVDQLLSDCEDGRVDVIFGLAYPLPATVVAEVLGVPAEDRDQFKVWSYAMVSFLASGAADRASALRADAELRHAREWLREMVARRRREPRDDILTALVAATDEPDGLTEPELLATCFGFLVAGHETTTNLIGNGLIALLTHPGALDALRASPDLLPTAVEELLRFDCPLQRTVRLAATDVELGGRHVRQGDFVYPMVAAANRDPTIFASPDKLVLDRSPNRHMAFGSGIHFCLGAGLARLEGRIALDALIRRSPRLAIDAEGLTWHRNVGFRGVTSLPVQFHSGPPRRAS